LGATAACTLQLMEEVQRDDDRTGAGLRADTWFGSIKAAVTLAKKGYNVVLQVKTGHGLFPKNFIESALEDATGGVWIVLEATHEGVPLIAIEYRYSTVLHCILW
jgi:hypothetical protein